jgi:hypothetical protein
MGSSQAVVRPWRGKQENEGDNPDETYPLPPQLGESDASNGNHYLVDQETRLGPSRALSTTSISSVSEFPGDPPPKRTAAERFYARRSALDKVDEIVQRSKSQTNVAATSCERLGLNTVDEARQFGRAGREFEGGGIEQRLLDR